TGQIGDALGLSIAKLPPDFLHRMLTYYPLLASVRAAPVLVCAATIAIIQLWPRITARVPGPLVALLATTAAVHLFGLPVETIHDRFGAVPSSLPSFRLPAIDWQQLPELFSPAVSIALLAAIESLLSAVVADGQIGGRPRSNAELLGQGIANIASPLFGGVPPPGAIARTPTHRRPGGRTPVPGVGPALPPLRAPGAAGPGGERAVGRVDSARDARGHPARRRVQHERVARVRAPAARAAQRRDRARRHLRAHRGRRPHGGDPGRRGARLAPVHAAHGGGDPGQ